MKRIKHILILPLALCMALLCSISSDAQPIEDSVLSFTCQGKCGKTIYFAEKYQEGKTTAPVIVQVNKNKYQLSFSFLDEAGNLLESNLSNVFSSNPEEAKNTVGLRTQYNNVRLSLKRRKKTMIVDVLNLETSFTDTTREHLRFKKGHFQIDANAFKENGIQENGRTKISLDLKKASRISD